MDDSETSLLKERLAWLEHFRLAAVFLLDDLLDTVEVHRVVDPLKVLIKIPLHHALAHGTREPFRVYLRAWAEIANCHVPRIDITEKYIQAEVLFKQRIWKEGSYAPKPTKTRFHRRPG